MFVTCSVIAFYSLTVKTFYVSATTVVSQNLFVKSGAPWVALRFRCRVRYVFICYNWSLLLVDHWVSVALIVSIIYLFELQLTTSVALAIFANRTQWVWWKFCQRSFGLYNIICFKCYHISFSFRSELFVDRIFTNFLIFYYHSLHHWIFIVKNTFEILKIIDDYFRFFHLFTLLMNLPDNWN